MASRSGSMDNINVEAANDFSTRTWKTDLTLILEGEPIYVCKQVLGLVSPVFDAMFGGDFKERDPNEVELPGKKREDFCKFLNCVYPNYLQKVSVANVHEVLPLADEYQVTRLKQACETFLIESLSEETSTDELHCLLQKSYLFNLETLKAGVIDLLVKKPQEEVEEAGTTFTLPPEFELDFQKKMIRILKTSSSEMEEKMKTLTALNGCLATTATENTIMSEYSKGNWKGDSAKFEVYLKGDLSEEINLSINRIKFTIKFDKPSYNYFLPMILKSASDVTYDARVIGMVIVKNWMAGKTDKVVFFTGRVRTSSANIYKDIGEKVKDETLGFIYQGKIKGDIHILVLDE